MFSPVSSRVFFGHRHKNRGKLSDLVAEHLDHLHYLNDILIINCEFLNDVLTDHLLNRLFLPLYVYSLVNPEIVCYFNPVPFTTAFFCQHSDLFFFLARGAKNQPSSVPLPAVSSELSAHIYLDEHGCDGTCNLCCVFQVFLIIHYPPLVHALADVILNGDLSVFTPPTDIHSAHKNTVTPPARHYVYNNIDLNCTD